MLLRGLRAALDRVLEGFRGDELVRRRREAQARADHERVRAAAVAHGGRGAGSVGHEPQAGQSRLVRIVSSVEQIADTIDPSFDRLRDSGVEQRDVPRHAHHERAARRLRGRRRLDAHPHLALRHDERLRASAHGDVCGRPARALVDARQRPVAGVRHPDAPVAFGDRRGRSSRPRPSSHGARRGVDRLDRPVELIGDPDRAPADRHRRRPTSDRDRRDGTGASSTRTTRFASR